jgi:arabinogalactan oligomer / maltooligosaccharide transport system permease protein
MSMIKTKSISKGNLVGNTIAYIVLTVLCLIWIIPIVWIILISFSKDVTGIPNYFWPQHGFTIQNYIKLFSDTGMQSGFYFPRWFLNTFYMAIVTCVISTLFVLGVSYAMSRMRFKMRKPFMNIALVLGFFPGFMALTAIYFLFKAINLTDTLLALILIYSGGAGLGFYIAKGFFDTIPKTLDEAAMIDGATKSEIFWKIIIPLSKPIIVYTIITSFLIPWFDFITVSFLIGPTAYNKFNVARGLFIMLDREHLQQYFTIFAAGAVLVSIPITILFIFTQKFFVEGVTGGSDKG